MKKRRLDRAPSTAGWFTVLMLVGLAGALASCYPGELDNVEELDVVASTHQQGTDFTQFSSWALSDTIGAIDARNPDDPQPIDLSQEQIDAINNTIIANMQAYGYGDPVTIPPDPTQGNLPDVYVQPGVVVSQGYVLFSYWPWYPYWGGWGCCWGGGWWGPGGGSQTFDIGSVVIDMLDLNDVDPDNPPSEDNPLLPVWMAGINGVLQGSSSTTRLENLIHQAYVQSPYLNTGNGSSTKK